MNLKRKQLIIIIFLISIISLILSLSELSMLVSNIDSNEQISSLQFASGGITFSLIFIIIGVLLIVFTKTNIETLNNQTSADEENKDESYENKNLDEEIIESKFEDIQIEDFKCSNKHNNISDFSTELLSKIANKFKIGIGIIYLKTEEDQFHYIAAYGYFSNSKPLPFKIGEGLNGQVVLNKKPIIISNIPEDYLTIISGLGNSKPKELLIIPIIREEIVIGVIELASFTKFNVDIDKFTNIISEYLWNNINQFNKSK